MIHLSPRQMTAWAIALATLTAAIGNPVKSLAQSDGAGFQSDQQLQQFLRRRLALPATTAPGDPNAPLANIVVTAEKAETTSITNNQEAGVDEGGTIKAHGDTLVILRRGRLFSVSIAKGGMRPVSTVDCFPPGLDASQDWYDEMLIAQDHVVVIGYSYSRGGTLINRFHINAAGRLTFEDAYQLGSSDYYSSRNYASRRVGNRLILYSPIPLDGADPMASVPRLGRWTAGDAKPTFQATTSSRRIFVPNMLRRNENGDVSMLHTVTTCDLTAPVLTCRATGMLGSWSRNFYVSSKAVYVWTIQDWTDLKRRRSLPALVYRLPLDGGQPTALGARGAPVDQLAFHEDPADRTLKVLVRSESDGDSMWSPEFTEGSVALATLPLKAFGAGDGEAPRSAYRRLPRPPEESYAFRDRFVGRYVLYGYNRDSQNAAAGGLVIATPVAGGPLARLPTSGGVGRIEAMGNDALVVGQTKDGVVFTAMELTANGGPRLGARYELKAASQHGGRTHAFFFRPDRPAAAPAGPNDGVLALPVAHDAEPQYADLFSSTASMLYLQRHARRFRPLGELASDQKGLRDDGCTASCVDWYGNARPVFIGKRMFALLGYELVEGRLAGGRVSEIARTDFTPPAATGPAK